MTIEQVKHIWENCPKSVEKLIDWYKAQMPKPIGKPEIDVPIQEAFKHADRALQISMSAATPRFLYEFFDENNIFPCVGRWKDSWIYTLDKTSNADWDGSAETRQECENHAFKKSFLVLEKQLND